VSQMAPNGIWSKVMHYIGNRVLFWTPRDKSVRHRSAILLSTWPGYDGCRVTKLDGLERANAGVSVNTLRERGVPRGTRDTYRNMLLYCCVL
jgi:hypothetical protein